MGLPLIYHEDLIVNLPLAAFAPRVVALRRLALRPVLRRLPLVGWPRVLKPTQILIHLTWFHLLAPFPDDFPSFAAGLSRGSRRPRNRVSGNRLHS